MFKKLFSLFLLCFLLTPVFVSADGGLVPPPNRRVFETDQKAVIFYEDKTENLVLSVGFKGDAEDFGWIVPTPNKPEVSKTSEELFTSLDELTKLKKIHESPAFRGAADFNQEIKEQVEVIETKKVEYYEISVLKAGDSEALADWLKENDYRFPKEGDYILDSYIKNDWYFTAIKIDAESVSSSLDDQLRRGHMVPLRLKFETDKIVYPLKISSLMQYTKNNFSEPSEPPEPPEPPMIEDSPPSSSRPQESSRKTPSSYKVFYPKNVGILLYVFTPERKQELPGFKVPYAGWIKKDTIEKMAYNDEGEPWLKPEKDKYFLTKMYRSMSYSQMNHDLYLRDAPDNELVNAETLDGDKEEEKDKTWFWIVMSISGVILLGSLVGFVYLSRN